MYRLRPEDFRTEGDVNKLIKYLEESPLNKQPLPDAGAKIGSYYRRLVRRPNEAVNAFLIREEKTHDDMIRALQRLMREKELSFEDYDMNLDQLKAFCGFKPGQSLYFGPEDRSLDEEYPVAQELPEDEERAATEEKTASPKSSRPGRPFTDRGSAGRRSLTPSRASTASQEEAPVKRGKDVLERLMEMGLMPLAALDHIRGWLLLEMAATSDEDRRLIKAATRNRLTYSEVRSALLGMFEEKASGMPKGAGRFGSQRTFYNEAEYYDYEQETPEPTDTALYTETGYDGQYDHGEEWQDWNDQFWGEEEETWPEETPPDEDLMRLQEEQNEIEKQRQELEMMLSETDRNLIEARRAVAAAAKDRGWTGTVQQRQPRTTSTFPWQNKGKGYGKPNTGRGSMNNNWVQPKGYGRQKGRSGKGYGGKGKHTFHMLSVDLPPEEMLFNPVQTSSSAESRSPTETLVDTGATATAGGKQAVRDLCKALVTARPDLKIDIHEQMRPWFRFGDGRWGRALYRVTITDVKTKANVSIYALPAPGVPVLTGMRELDNMNVILNCRTGRCLIHGRPVVLEKNPKNHLILDYLKHVFYDSTPVNEPNAPRSSTPSSPSKTTTKRTSRPTSRVRFAETNECKVLDMHTLDFFFGEDCEVEQASQCDPVFPDANEHLGVTSDALQFLLGQDFSKKADQSATTSLLHGEQGGVEGRDSEGCDGGPRGSGKLINGWWKRKAEGQKPPKSDFRRDSEDGSRRERSKEQQDSMALHGEAHVQHGGKPLRQMGAMQSMWSSAKLHPSNNGSSTEHPMRPATECGRGDVKAQEPGLGGGRVDGGAGQGNDLHCVQGVPVAKDEGSWLQAQSLDQEEGTAEGGGSQFPIDRNVSRTDLGQRGSEQGQVHQQPGSSAGKVMAWMEDEKPICGHTRQQLLAATTELDASKNLADLLDYTLPCKIWEVCCRADSALSSACESLGFQVWRKTLETGYDMGKQAHIQKLVEEAKVDPPDRAWFSLLCTAVTAIQRLNQRDLRQVEELRKKRQKCRKHLRGAILIIWTLLTVTQGKSKFYFEWPKGATDGWQLPELREFIRQFNEYYGRLYFVQIDGCMHGMKSPDDWPIRKSWMVMTNDAEFYDRCRIVCDGSHQHRPDGMIGMGSKAVSATAFYPASMVNGIARLWKSQWKRAMEANNHYIHQTINMIETTYAGEAMSTKPVQASSNQATSQTPEEQGFDVQKAWTMLHRLHRAAGHPNNKSLARLCHDRGLPPWLVQMALNLKCQACEEVKKGEQLVLPVSVGERARPWQIIGLDVFELAFPSQYKKARFLIMVDLTMRLVSVYHLWEGNLSDVGTDSGEKLIQAFIEGWLLHKPKPEWVLADSQTSLCKGVFSEFLSSIGVGLSVTAGQAHWQHGSTESMVKVLKSTMKRLRNEQPMLKPSVCGHLAAAAQNNTDHIKGFTPVQWAYGCDPSQWGVASDITAINAEFETRPLEYWQLQKNRTTAEEIHRQEMAKQRITRLQNAASRPTSAYQVGDWVCVWRKATVKSRQQEFNPEARFIGPGRIAMIEPHVLPEGRSSVIWVLMGTVLWRCAPEQLRPATEPEITTEVIRLGELAVLPLTDLLTRLHSSVDVAKEPKFNAEEDLLPELPPEHGVEPSSQSTAAQSPEQWRREISQGPRSSEGSGARRRSRSRSADYERNFERDCAQAKAGFPEQVSTTWRFTTSPSTTTTNWVVDCW